LLGIKRFEPPLVAAEAPRSAQRSIITSAYRGTKAAPAKLAEGACGGAVGHRHKKPPGGEPGGLFIFSAILAPSAPAQGSRGCNRPAHSVKSIRFRRNHFSEATKSA
jgi:hypothetical protein